MRCALLLVVTACGFEHGRLATDASVIDAPDAPGDSSTMLDSDGDGVLDTTDICPQHADPTQRDHDGDGFGDACDGCPPFASTTNSDQDGDGVGDDCDPRPAAAGDSRALWIGFYDEDTARITNTAEWSRVGPWAIANGWVGVTTGTSLATLRSLSEVPRALAYTAIRLDEFTSNSAAAGLIVGLQGSPGNVTDFYQCALFRADPSIGARSQVDDVELSDNYEIWSGSVANATVIELAARFTNVLDCRFSPPQDSVQATATTTVGEVEVVAQRASVSFDYLFVVDAGM